MFEGQSWLPCPCKRTLPVVEKTLGNVLKGKHLEIFFSQDHSSVIHFEADLDWETCFCNLVAGLKTHRFQGTAYLLRSTQIARNKLSDRGFTILFLCLCLSPTPLLNFQNT